MTAANTTPPHDPANPEPYQRVMALPEDLRKELNYLAFMPYPNINPAEFHHNIAVSGERILEREAQAFNAGIEAALGAIPEPRVFDHGFNDASHYYKEALDQARAAIERKRK